MVKWSDTWYEKPDQNGIKFDWVKEYFFLFIYMLNFYIQFIYDTAITVDYIFIKFGPTDKGCSVREGQGFQRHIQNPVKHLRQRVLQKRLTVFRR